MGGSRRIRIIVGVVDPSLAVSPSGIRGTAKPVGDPAASAPSTSSAAGWEAEARQLLAQHGLEPHVARHGEDEAFLSVVTASELLHGVHRAAQPDVPPASSR